jgi:hypothetical protein
VAQTQPFTLQRFSVRKTPVFRTPSGGEKIEVNSLLSFPGHRVAIHGSFTARIMSNGPLFKGATESLRTGAFERTLTPSAFQSTGQRTALFVTYTMAFYPMKRIVISRGPVLLAGMED